MKEKYIKSGIVLLVFLLSISLALAVLSNYISVNGTATVTASPKWVQTTEADFNTGIKTNVVVVQPGDVYLKKGNTTVFNDSFEGWGSLSCDHNGIWNSCNDGDGDIKRDTDCDGHTDVCSSPPNGTRHLKFEDHDSDTDYLIKCVNLSGYSNVYVRFYWAKHDLESGEYGKLDINTSTSDYTNVFNSGNGTANYTVKEINITSYISPKTCFKWHALASSDDDEFYIDDFKILGETYNPSGNLISSAFDAGSNSSWKKIYWTANIPSGTSIKFRTRTSPNNSSWSIWSSNYTSSPSNITSPNNQWIQYQAILETNNTANSPILNDVTIYYRT